MKRIGSRLVVVLMALLLIALAAGVGGYLYWSDVTRRPLPRYEGEASVTGLKRPVEIVRDAAGVPHLYAQNLHDLFFAQGYVHAQDRWFQMDLFRHLGSGTLGELLGYNPDALGRDIMTRTLGVRQVAEKEAKLIGEPYRSYFQAFVDGVNAYIGGQGPGELALEYTLLGWSGLEIEIRPWTLADTLVMGKVMAEDLSANGDRELIRARLLEHFGEEMTAAYMPPWPHGEMPTILPATGQHASVEPTAYRSPDFGLRSIVLAGGLLPGEGLFLGDKTANGSNNWVVSGRLTESGKPLLANDPHLGVRMPSIWYQIGLHAAASGGVPAYDVAGFALPTAPMVIIGHNGRIAWGVTNGEADCQDHYRIRVNPNNPLQYAWEGGWRDMTVREETIRFVDGREPVTIRVRETHLGPIINDNRLDEASGALTGFNNEDPLALRWTGLDPSAHYTAIFDYNTARNWEEFTKAIAKWDTPSQNFVYADTEGNIGYIFGGRVPYRKAHHDGKTPAPGWSEAYAWAGYIPYDYLPKLFNPPEGYIGTANQCVAPPEFYERLRREFGDGFRFEINDDTAAYGYRGKRVFELLDGSKVHSMDTFKAMQGDVYVGHAPELLAVLKELAFADDETRDLAHWLAGWDCRAEAESPQAVLFAQFWTRLMANLFDDQLPEGLRGRGVSQEMWVVHRLLAEPEHAFWDDARTVDRMETRDEILVKSFEEAHQETIRTQGPDRNRWRWDWIHRVRFVNPPIGISGVGFLEGIVNRGPRGVPGSMETLNRMRWSADRGNFDVYHISSMRMIVDLGNPSRSVAINNTGQSGHPYSPHYDDQIALWAFGQYRPMYWTRKDLEAEAHATLTLQPGGSTGRP